MRIKTNDTIVFFGDSVTDTCRFVKSEYPYGSGYVLMVDAHINTNYTDMNIKVINKGISGNRTKDLVARVDSDVNAYHPNTVFVLIGVNDVWRRYDCNDPTSTEQFIKNYKTFLDSIKKANPGVNIVIMTPFTLPSNDWVLALTDELKEKTQAILDIASEYNLDVIPLHEILPSYGKIITPEMVARDGIHPTLVGHAIMSEKILDYLVR